MAVLFTVVLFTTVLFEAATLEAATRAPVHCRAGGSRAEVVIELSVSGLVALPASPC
jgi:hypothetical protein